MRQTVRALAPEMISLKGHLKDAWAAGDFTLIAMSYEAGAGEFISRLNLARGARALDVACGTGNLAVPAARAGAVVTGVDIAVNLLEEGRMRALCDGAQVQFDEGDAEQLPYGDASFDVVMSMFGVMYAPCPGRAAAELTRVCRPGGRIALANWTPAGFMGQMSRLIAARVFPTPLMRPPVLWGEEEVARERLRENVADFRCARRRISLKFPFAPAGVVEIWRGYDGPTRRAFETLNSDPEEQAALCQDLEWLWAEHNLAKGAATHVEAEYLEIIATRS
jgi:SAM-dependent methyltransferase